MKLNDLTFVINIFFLPIWLVWELVLLKIRGKGLDVDTISIVMKNRAYQMNSLLFFWSAMMAHWWFNWLRHEVWSVPWFGVAFWLMVIGTLALDIFLWNHSYAGFSNLAKVLRAPMVQCALGILAAYFLFPQRANDAPGWRWW